MSQSVWDVTPEQSPTIEGFTDSPSVDDGQTINFKVSTSATSYHIDIYRLGYYGGGGGRLVTTLRPSVWLPQTQPHCVQERSTGLTDCNNWAVSASWAVPQTTVSGIFLADLRRDDGVADASQITFVVRNDSRASALLFQTDDETEQAYNQWGGNSLYRGTWGPGSRGRAYKVSYNRPSMDRYNNKRATVFAAQYPMLRWLEENGYDVSYITGVDVERSGAQLLANHRVFLSVGHDEYVSAAQRANIEAARSRGVNLGYFSGDEMAWKTRFETSITGPPTSYRTLVCYKETKPGQDPSGVWTGHWGDPAGGTSAGLPPNALSGQRLFGVMGSEASALSIDVPYSFHPLPFWRNTAVAALKPGSAAKLGTSVLGYEWDVVPNDRFRPPGLITMSYTVVPGISGHVHQLSLYRASSGAVVFGAGTIQWSWGLDGHHDLGPSIPSVTMEQATVNLLASMGVEPATLAPQLARP